jgi:general secretion pathway protein H
MQARGARREDCEKEIERILDGNGTWNPEKLLAPTNDRELKSFSRIFGQQRRAASKCPRFSTAGFTLLELLVVIVLISIMTALVVPRLPSTGSMALKSSARSTAALLRYLGERSSGSKNIYRLHINISENTIKVTRKLPNGEEVAPDDQLLTRKILESGVVIVDMQSPRLGKVTEGEVLIDFGTAGLSEFLTLHLSSPQGESFTIAGFPAGGKVKLLAGYQELTL